MLAILAERAGEPLETLYGTRTVRTGRGGHHLYFTAPDEARLGNTAGELGLLVRADGSADRRPDRRMHRLGT